MKKLVSIFFLILLFSEIGFGQALLEGTVKDMRTGKPLSGVNVYLSGTIFGTSTDNNGRYKFSPSTTGSHQLVFSFVGYQKEVRQVELKSSSAFTRNVSMKEKVNKLETIEVTASNEEWQKQYSIFFDQFIGKTELASEVTIENPWVLDFKERKGLIIATAKKPLTVINMALGYKIYVELVKFEWPKYQDRGGIYMIYPKYERLTPDGEQQQHRWKKNRIKSYAGSLDHFLKSLYTNKLEENNFSVDQSRNLSPLPQGKTKYELMSKPDIPYAARETAKGFELKGKIDVKFDGNIKYEFDGTTYSVSIEKQGGIMSKARDHFFFIDRYGTLLNPVSLQMYQWWADSRMANSLPKNYSIAN
jgi:hypothetical protein